MYRKRKSETQAFNSKGTTSFQLAPNDTAKAVKTLRQSPTTQQTTSAMELIVSISKPISSLGETLTVGHHRTKHPGRGSVAETQADHPAHLLLSTLA